MCNGKKIIPREGIQDFIPSCDRCLLLFCFCLDLLVLSSSHITINIYIQSTMPKCFHSLLLDKLIVKIKSSLFILLYFILSILIIYENCVTNAFREKKVHTLYAYLRKPLIQILIKFVISN